MLTNSRNCQTFFTFPCPLSGIVSKQKIVYKWGKKCRNHTSEEENTTHTQYLNTVMSSAINGEAGKFVLTFNQTKDQRNEDTFRHKTVPLPTYLSFLMCSLIAEICIQLVDAL